MLKRTGAFFILSAFILQGFYSPFLIIDYYVNTAIYKQNCINKAKAWLHCDGKCQLMKKLLQQEKKEQENNELKTGKNEFCLSSKSFFISAPLVNNLHLTPDFPEYSSSGSDGISPSIFHPPC